MNQILGWTGTGKRRKSTAVGAQSCEIEGDHAPDIPIVSMRSGFFTDDYNGLNNHFRSRT
ncbi:hypothetical protein BB934_15865 [Microvirga ossetica]|uniref:Uncharacterized protein n=1 Tax=Microvirga ossetica TaxID=1882682 RepID=A0A1B2EHV3_9HYPH|nr:hypothetical protein BB934_15865 [Microvirga ossetica]